MEFDKLTSNVEKVAYTAKSAQSVSGNAFVPTAMFSLDLCKIKKSIRRLLNGRTAFVLLPHGQSFWVRVYITFERDWHSFSNWKSETGFPRYGE